MQQTIPQFRFATTRLATGPRVHYLEQGSPGGQEIVCIHGYADSCFSYSRLLPLLPTHYRTYALSLRGHGDSDRPNCCYKVDDLASDVVAFLNAICATQVTIVGDSSGGIIARKVAETYPERVARLVLIGAPIRVPINEATSGVQEALLTLEDPVPLEFVRDFQAGAVHVPLPESFFQSVISESLKLPARVWRSALEGLLDADDSEQLHRITVPTLIIWGEQDPFVSREEQKRLASAIPGAQMITYPETGHMPHWERPDTVAVDLDAFVKAMSVERVQDSQA